MEKYIDNLTNVDPELTSIKSIIGHLSANKDGFVKYGHFNHFYNIIQKSREVGETGHFKCQRHVSNDTSIPVYKE